MLIGVVMAIVVVLAGAGVGAWFVLRDDQTAETTTTGVAASTTETTGSQSTVTTAPGATTQTVPNATGSSIGSTSTTAAGQKAAYVAAIGDLAADLEYDDDRIPVLATRINDTAPNVPAWVRDELEGMLDALDIASMNLAGLLVPPGFGRSHYWLEEAVRHMANRIYATIQGIEIMWSTGNVGSGDLYFNEGRTERDAYRSAIDKYYEFLPAE